MQLWYLFLNEKIKINCKFKKSNYSGPLQWSGEDYRYANLKRYCLPCRIFAGRFADNKWIYKHFPEGIPVGTIEDFKIKERMPIII